MWAPLAYKDSTVMVSVLPLPYSQSLYLLPLFCHLQGEWKTQGPLPGPQP